MFWGDIKWTPKRIFLTSLFLFSLYTKLFSFALKQRYPHVTNSYRGAWNQTDYPKSPDPQNFSNHSTICSTILAREWNCSEYSRVKKHFSILEILFWIGYALGSIWLFFTGFSTMLATIHKKNGMTRNRNRNVDFQNINLDLEKNMDVQSDEMQVLFDSESIKESYTFSNHFTTPSNITITPTQYICHVPGGGNTTEQMTSYLKSVFGYEWSVSPDRDLEFMMENNNYSVYIPYDHTRDVTGSRVLVNKTDIDMAIMDIKNKL